MSVTGTSVEYELVENKSDVYEINTKDWITKSNIIIESQYKLSLQEQRILLITASKVQPNDEDFKPYKFRVSDLGAKIGASKNTSMYSYIKDVVTGLQRKTLTYKSGTKTVVANWLVTSIYEESEGTVVLKFNPDLKHYFLQLKEKFTSYQLENVIQLSSVYSIRIYELLKQYEAIRRRTFTIEELKHILGIEPTQYEKYAHLKAKVINVAKKEIEKKTDISFDFEEIKKGRKVVKLTFNIKSKQVEQQLELLEFSSAEDSDGQGTFFTPPPPSEYLNEEEFERDTIRKTLSQYKISAKVIESLFKRFPLDKIKRNVEYMQNYESPITAPAKFLKNAVEQDYANNPFPTMKSQVSRQPIRKEIVPDHILKAKEEEDIMNGSDLQAKQHLYFEKYKDFENMLAKSYEIAERIFELSNGDKTDESTLKAKETKALESVRNLMAKDYEERKALELKPRFIKEFQNKAFKDVYRGFLQEQKEKEQLVSAV